MRRTGVVMASVAVVLSLFAAGCASEPEELTPVSLQMHFLPEPSWGIYLNGIESGIFEKHGIELELIPGQGSNFTMQQLNEGKADFGSASLIAYLANRASVGEGTMAVFAPMHHPQAGIVTTAQADTLADLAGTTVGMIPFSVSNILLPLVLTENGLDPDSVTIESIQTTSPSIMFEGAVDGLEVYLGGNVATTLKQAEDEGIDVSYIDLHDYGLEGYANTIIVRKEILDNDPDLVERMVAAIDESLAAAQDADPKDLAALVRERAPEYTEEIVMLEWADYQKLLADPGVFEENVVQTNLDYVSGALGIPHQLTPADVYTNQYVPGA